MRELRIIVMLMAIYGVALTANLIETPSKKEQSKMTGLNMFVHSYRKDYFKYAKITKLLVRKQLAGYKIELETLKPVTKDDIILIEYFFKFNDEFKKIDPMTINLSLEKLYESDFAGIGSAFKKSIGDLPLPPKKLVLRLRSTMSNNVTPQLPGKYKVMFKLMSGGSLETLAVEWDGDITK